MMSDLYTPKSTGFEGTASDHIKEEMQKLQIKLNQMLGTKLKSIDFYITTGSYGYQDELDGSFELTVRVYDDNDDRSDIKYTHSAPNLDDAISHVTRHINADLDGPVIGSGRFRLPKLIAS
tara:strand:- start:352 stop:714 length:363 start_codon:yes stop_codon:yes gene_type:complete